MFALVKASSFEETYRAVRRQGNLDAKTVPGTWLPGCRGGRDCTLASWASKGQTAEGTVQAHGKPWRITETRNRRVEMNWLCLNPAYIGERREANTEGYPYL